MKVEGYGESSTPSWLWPVALLLSAAMVCGTLVFCGFIVLRLTAAPAPAVVPAIPLAPTAAAPLAADSVNAPLTQQAQAILAGSPLAPEVRDTLWGCAVAIDQSRATLKTPQQVTGLIERAGRIVFGARQALPAPLTAQLDAILLAQLGTEPTAIDDARRARLIAALRAMAYGADLAAAGS